MEERILKIEMKGPLELSMNEGGCVSSAIYIDGEALDDAISKILDISDPKGYGVGHDKPIGICRLTLTIIPDEKILKKIRKMHEPPKVKRKSEISSISGYHTFS